MWNFKGYLWNSTQNILPIHWKIRFLYDIEILRALRFKSSYAFLKRPPANTKFKSVYFSIEWNIYFCKIGVRFTPRGSVTQTIPNLANEEIKIWLHVESVPENSYRKVTVLKYFSRNFINSPTMWSWWQLSTLHWTWSLLQNSWATFHLLKIMSTVGLRSIWWILKITMES